jgi:inner membrane protein
MIWWVWVLFGLALLVAEMAAPGTFFFLFFGLSALVVGALAGLGLVPQPWLQWILFSVLSILAFALLRGPLKGRFNLRGSQRVVDTMVGEVAIVTTEVPVGGVGKVELRGTTWSARTTNASALAVGQRTVVERVDGLTFWVRPE